MHADLARPSRSRRTVVALLALAAAALLLDAGWIHAKAVLAQHLLQRAWVASLDGQPQKPWPSADTQPVARLQLARLGVDQIVLEGDSGRSLAFGPGWAPASAAPGGDGTVVVSGHRDTHFDWLSEVRVGDRLQLQGAAGTRQYVVRATMVADSRVDRLAVDGDDRLLLVTCWPFDAVASGGPQRYVVVAEPCSDCSQPLPFAAPRLAGLR